MSEENKGTGEAGNTGGDNGTGGKTQADLAALSVKLDAIDKKVSAGQVLTQQDNAVLTSLLNDESHAEDDAQKVAKEKQDFGELDFDKLSNKDLASHIVKFIGTELATMKKELFAQSTEASQKVADVTIREEINQCRIDHSEDFNKLYEKVIKTARDNPTLSVEQAYKLTKADVLLNQDKQVKEDQAKVEKRKLSVSTRDSIASQDLSESLKGKDTRETARLIAERIGLG